MKKLYFGKNKNILMKKKTIATTRKAIYIIFLLVLLSLTLSEKVDIPKPMYRCGLDLGPIIEIKPLDSKTDTNLKRNLDGDNGFKQFNIF